MGRWWSIFSGISVLSHYPFLTKCSGSAHACSACESARLKLNCWRTYFMRGSRKFCHIAEGIQLWQRLFFKVDEGREDLSPTWSGPSSARLRNTIKWRFAGMSMNAQHWMLALQLRFFRGSGPVLLEKPVFWWFFRGGGPDLDPHM